MAKFVLTSLLIRPISKTRLFWQRIQYGSLSQPEQSDPIIRGEMEAVRTYFDRRESRYLHADAVIPDVMLDLQSLKQHPLPECQEKVRRRHTQDARQKYQDLCIEFQGQPELLALHALVMALLRRRGCPPRFQRLFLRMWREEGEFLANNLEVRWLISAATTFSDVGANVRQRLAGQGFALTFDLIKLHDSERRLSGRSCASPFQHVSPKVAPPLPFDLDPFAFAFGDLDFSILMRLEKLSNSAPIFKPLGQKLLERLNEDHRTIFARVQKLKPSKG